VGQRKEKTKGDEMRTIKLTDKAYADLLELKNHISAKTRTITNKEALKDIVHCDRREIDMEKKYTFSKCVEDVVGSIWNEQETGEVNYIT
jgi:predicted CopG family antitoxin